jgi:formate hydrogenlyase subunit 3/multisubunit Na+/H+ antiporter MnhD subunit
VGFLVALALLVAAVVVAATVILVWNLNPRRWAQTAAVAGAVSLALGVMLYLVVVGIALNNYDEESRPGWLTGMGVVAGALAVGGLLAIVSSTVGAVRRR